MQTKRRKQYIVDRPMQMAVVRFGLCLLASLFFIVFAVAFILPSEDYFSGMTGAEARNMALRLFIGSFLACTGGLTMVAIIVSHRMAGPAMVLKAAVEGFMIGNYRRRTALRDKDYLKDLAATIGRHGADLESRYAKRVELLDRLEENLDAEGRALVAELRQLDPGGRERSAEEPRPLAHA